MKRIIKGLALLILLLVALLGGPVLYVETMCRGDATPAPYTPLSSETRPETRTLLTYPEWHIVHAYEEYAHVITRDDPHDYGYLRAVTGYWSSLCTLTENAAELGEVDGPTRQLVYVIGASFTFEMVMKAAYEETIGRVVTWIRGAEHSPLDVLSASQAAEYATFLQQVPWYRWDFRADADALSAASTGVFRDRERSLALGLEHRTRALYADAIGNAVAATGFDDLTLQMVVTGVAAETLAGFDGVTVLQDTEDGLEIETPRYRELTYLLAEMAEAGVRFIDMAGNDQIMFTALSPEPGFPDALASLPRQGIGDTRHLFLVPVSELADALLALPGRGLTLEHVHDY